MTTASYPSDSEIVRAIAARSSGRSPPARTILVTSRRPRSGEMGGSDGVATGERGTIPSHHQSAFCGWSALPLKGDERRPLRKRRGGDPLCEVDGVDLDPERMRHA